MRSFAAMVGALALAACATASVDGPGNAAQPASVAELMEDVQLGYETFTLENGLTVIVHEDRKAPIVAVA